MLHIEVQTVHKTSSTIKKSIIGLRIETNWKWQSTVQNIWYSLDVGNSASDGMMGFII